MRGTIGKDGGGGGGVSSFFSAIFIYQRDTPALRGDGVTLLLVHSE